MQTHTIFHSTELQYCFRAHLLTIRMQFSAIRSWDLARAAEGSLLFCAKAQALDDPRVGPGGQLRAERAKVMSSCGKSDESLLVEPLFHKEGRMHNNMTLVTGFSDAYKRLIYVSLAVAKLAHHDNSVVIEK